MKTKRLSDLRQVGDPPSTAVDHRSTASFGGVTSQFASQLCDWTLQIDSGSGEKTTLVSRRPLWSKYGKLMGTMLEFTDPKTKQPPSTNLLNSADYGMTLPNLGNTIESVVKRGTQFAVCDMATHFFAGEVAKASGQNADATYKELVANTIPNSRMVAAGVVAVNRAQEYGYTLLTAL